MKIKVPYEVSNFESTDAPGFLSTLARALNTVVQVINGRINFVENCQVKIVTVVFNAVNTQQAIQHGLNKIPTGFIMVGTRAAVRVYNGTNVNSSQTIYLQADVATTVTLMIF